MDEKLREEIQKRLALKENPAKMRTELVQSGYAEHEVDAALKSEADHHVHVQDSKDKHNSRILALREFIDRFGYGAASPQFINILFYVTGAGIFTLGILNGIRAVLSMLISSVMQEYSRVHKVGKNVISAAGIIFGFSFLIMAFAIRARVVWLYAVGMLIASLGVVTYGDLYQKLVFETIRREKMGGILKRMGQYGVLITMVSMLISGWVIERFPETGSYTFNLFGMTITPIGYLLSFEITAFAFIISGYLLSMLKGHRAERKYSFGRFVREHYSSLRGHVGSCFKNKYITFLILATLITGLLEVLGQSYYGLFIWKEFGRSYITVAVLYAIAIMISFIGPWFTKLLQRSIGLSPMLVFGTLLTAILPFALVYNPHLFAVGAALICSVLGAAIIGVAQGLLARKLMSEEQRKKYFMSLGLIVAIPYLLLIPVGAWFAHTYTLEHLFLAIGVGLALVVAPLYLILVAMASKQRL
ncbi:MFS transporter [Candidatus Woesearchaeota archaeon]|nr:MFS transporter [Candidatus Woesearchaeota archaeon]